MGVVKFSQFTNKTTLADADYVAGYSGSSNIRVTLYNLWLYIKAKADYFFTTKLYATQNVPANTSSGAWYRIAASPTGVSKCDGLFELEIYTSGYHQRVSFKAGIMYNNARSPYIQLIGNSCSSIPYPLQFVRLVYKSDSYANEYAYVDVFCVNPNTSAATLKVSVVNEIGWELADGDSSIPTGYTEKRLSVYHTKTNYSTNDTRVVLTPSNGSVDLDFRYPNRSTVAMNITQNTTINFIRCYDGLVGNVLLYLSGTYTITIGSVTNENGNSMTKFKSGNLTSLAPGNYILSYKVIPDYSGTWKIFFNVSDMYDAI